MSRRGLIVIFLLILSLLIQNTCPFGSAGKSSVLPSCSKCMHKQALTTPSAAAGQISIAPRQASPLPAFVLALPHPLPLFRLVWSVSPEPAIPNTYKNVLPDEVLRPPSA